MGVAVAVVQHENSAIIKNAAITAKNLTLTAKSGTEEDKITSSASAKAGYSAGSIGLGGAVAVHVASAKTKALIYNTANITMSGALTLAASSYERFHHRGRRFRRAQKPPPQAWARASPSPSTARTSSRACRTAH